jgi:hypothetical protein
MARSLWNVHILEFGEQIGYQAVNKVRLESTKQNDRKKVSAKEKTMGSPSTSTSSRNDLRPAFAIGAGS